MEIIINSFESAIITEVVTQELPNEDLFANLDYENVFLC